jgi:hypothetical protein
VNVLPLGLISETMKSLREEAKQKDIGTNTLLDQIVKEHLK